MNEKECAAIMDRHGWVAEISNSGMWMIGPQTSEGLLDVWGQGTDLREAVENALRSIEHSRIEHGLKASV